MPRAQYPTGPCPTPLSLWERRAAIAAPANARLTRGGGGGYYASLAR